MQFLCKNAVALRLFQVDHDRDSGQRPETGYRYEISNDTLVLRQ